MFTSRLNSLLGIPFFITESPRWLIQRSRRDEAIKNLCYLRKLDRNDAYLIQEINDIDLQGELSAYLRAEDVESTDIPSLPAVEHDRSAVGQSFWAPFRQVFT